MTAYYDALKDQRSCGRLPETSRMRCPCGCERRATHYGAAKECTMMVGCELYVRRWVKSPNEALSTKIRLQK